MASTLEHMDDWIAYVDGGASDTVLLGQALRRAFFAVDERLRVHQHGTTDSSGCTSATAVITHTYRLRQRWRLSLLPGPGGHLRANVTRPQAQQPRGEGTH